MIRFLFVVCLLAGMGVFPGAGWAQEDVLVVVNESSPDSLTLANHYISLRTIPASNVVYLSDVPARADRETNRSVLFKERILEPVMKAMEERGIQSQIRFVTFSATFPTRTEIKDMRDGYLEAREEKFSKYFHHPFVSFCGAMFFNEALFSDGAWFLEPNANWYADPMATETRAFASRETWPDQKPSSQRPEARFYLTTMLAVVRPNGSTLKQAIQQLERSVKADGTAPKGLFYMSKHGDPRSKTRHDQFEAAAQLLQEMGFEARIDSPRMPNDEASVVGAMLGSARLDWSKSQSTFAPGAICDNFTSFGGFFQQKSQTTLTHWLDQGAAGAVGTVFEPYTIPFKIPTAMWQVHYARGCTLAESLYQTIGNPYVLLVVGDPICRPFAKFAQFEVDGISDRSLIKQDLTITCQPTGDSQVDSVSVYVDGIRDSQGNSPGQPVNLSIDDLGYGYHEIRVVAIGPDPVRVRTSQVFEVFVQPQVSEKWGDLRLTVEDNEQDESESFSVAYKLPEGASGEIRQNQRVITKLSARRTSVDIPASKLGGGPSRIRLVVEDEGQIVSGVPVPVVVTGGTDE